MVQEDCPDYFEEYSEDEICGCCLCCPKAEDGCLCTDCKCTKCYWYEFDEDINEGSCGLACSWKSERREGNRYSELQIKNITQTSNKAYFGQIGFSSLIWIPKSVVNSKGFVKKWFVNKLRDKRENIDVK